MNRIVFVVALILGMATGPQSQASLPLFQKMFLFHSIQISGMVGADQQKYDGVCDKRVQDATDFGDNRAHRLIDALSQPLAAPFDVNFIGVCDTPMTFNYANLIPSADGDLTKFKLELGVIDNTNDIGLHRVIVNAPCTEKHTPGSPLGGTELVCTVSGATGTGTITFISQD